MSAALRSLPSPAQNRIRTLHCCIKGTCACVHAASNIGSWIQNTEDPFAIEGMLRAQEDFKIGACRDCMLLSLKDALLLVEGGTRPEPSIEEYAYLLNKCRKEGDQAQARRLHTHLLKNGLDTYIPLENYLVPMLAEVGSMNDAQRAFDRLASPNECSWNSLITGYTKFGKAESALTLYGTMIHDDSLHASRRTFSALLKACAKMKNLENGLPIHAEVARLGLLETDPFVCSALIDMYAKCGLLANAHQVFDRLPFRDVVSWTALMTGLIEHGNGKEALKHFEQMQLESVSPDVITFLCCLKACGIVQVAKKGREIHAQIESFGLFDRDPAVGTTLVDMYAKCGCPFISQEVFDKIPGRDVISWNALISGYADHGHGEEAINSFEQMQLEGVSPDVVTLVCTLNACGSIGAIELGGDIHSEIERMGLQRELVVGNALVDFYANCGLLVVAQELFDRLPVRDVVSWTSLIGGYADHDYGEEALELFEQMGAMGIPPNAATYICSLKACGSTGLRDKAQDLHSEIERKGLLESDLVVGNTLVDMYAKCGMLFLAQEVFDKLPIRDVVSWTALIAGYVEHGHCDVALKCFENMQLDDVTPNAFTYVCSLKACAALGATEKGREIHAEIKRKGQMGSNPVIGNTLVDMYAKCGSLDLAKQAFNSLRVQDVIAWTTLITGYVEHGQGEAAIERFEQMQRDGVFPNAATFVCGLKACGSIGAIDKVEKIHAQIEKEGLLEAEPVVGNTLVDMYAKCSRLAEARQVFDKLRNRDVVSWTALIGGYGEYGKGEDALYFFQQMQLDGIMPNAVTFVCGLKACCDVGAKDVGQDIHTEIERTGLLERDLIVGNTLVEMYAQWGSLATAEQVFDKLPARDVVSCNSLIAGYAQVGSSAHALHMFDRMLGESIKPDSVTFIVVLNACSRAGLFNKSQTFFEAMSKDFGIRPTLEHHAGMVDLFCRVGHLDKAVAIIKKMPYSPDLVVWNTVLSACRKWGTVELGKEAFKSSVHLDGKDAAAYVLMSHILAEYDKMSQ